MTDPPAPAGLLVLVVEDWSRRLARDGDPTPDAHVRAVLAELALAAPGVAAHCPMLLATVGPLLSA